MRWFALLFALALVLPFRQSANARPLDYAVPGGYFYTQTTNSERGFLVSDSDGIPFLSEFRSRGGPDVLGYPVSTRFEWKGTTVQAFQKAVLQWVPEEHRIAFVNVFDDLSEANKDQWLLEVRSTPKPVWLENEDKLNWDEIVKGRLAFLDANPAIKARYFSVADPMTLFGLPSSPIEDMGNHFAIRLQRAVIQQWKVDVPWARAGEVTVANGGDIAREVGLFPTFAVEPTDPDGAAPSSPAISFGGSPFKEAPLEAIPSPTGPRRVVLDPGHGGREVGAAGRTPSGMYEKDVNLDIALRTAALLREAGYEVTLTRDSDRAVGGPTLTNDLQARVDIANDAQADVFVSIHNNGHNDRNQRGTEVYYSNSRPFSDRSRDLASLVYLQIGRSLNAAGYEPQPRGAKADARAGRPFHYFVLAPATSRVQRPSQMPAIIGESLFMTNPADAAQLGRPEIRQAIAKGYAAGIGQFLTR